MESTKLKRFFQMVHKSIDDEVYSASDLAGKIEVVEPKLNQEKSPNLIAKEPTLEKPFQCEFCGKCFAHYQVEKAGPIYLV